MSRLAELNISVLQCVLQVFDPHAAKPGGNTWSDVGVAQGFSARPQSASFQITEDSCELPVEVHLTERRPEVRGFRAIAVPFEVVAPGEVEIGNIYAGAREAVVAIPEGRYTLTFELLVDAEAEADAWREETLIHPDKTEVGPPLRCLLTFSKERIDGPILLANGGDLVLEPTAVLVMDGKLA